MSYARCVFLFMSSLYTGSTALQENHYPHGVTSMNDLILNIASSNARSNPLYNTVLPFFFRTSEVQALCPKGCFPFICAIRLNVCSSFRRRHVKKRAIQQEITLYLLSIELQQRAAQMARAEKKSGSCIWSQRARWRGVQIWVES